MFQENATTHVPFPLSHTPLVTVPSGVAGGVDSCVGCWPECHTVGSHRLLVFSDQSQMTLPIVVKTEFPFQLRVLLKFLSNSQASSLWIQHINKQDGLQPSYLLSLTDSQDGLQPCYRFLSLCRQICVSLAAFLETVTLTLQMSLSGQTCSTLTQTYLPLLRIYQQGTEKKKPSRLCSHKWNYQCFWIRA